MQKFLSSCFFLFLGTVLSLHAIQPSDNSSDPQEENMLYSLPASTLNLLTETLALISGNAPHSASSSHEANTNAEIVTQADSNAPNAQSSEAPSNMLAPYAISECVQPLPQTTPTPLIPYAISECVAVVRECTSPEPSSVSAVDGTPFLLTCTPETETVDVTPLMTPPLMEIADQPAREKKALRADHISLQQIQEILKKGKTLKINTPEDLTKIALKNCNRLHFNIDTLDLEQLCDLLPTCLQVTEITIMPEASATILHWDTIARFENLTRLSVPKTSIEDLDPIANLKKIRLLNFSGTNVRDLGPIQNLHRLTHLLMMDISPQSFSPLKNLQHLRSLYACMTGLQSLEPISHFESLESLDMSNNPDITSLTPLFEMPQLKMLSALNCTGLSQMSFYELKLHQPHLSLTV